MQGRLWLTNPGAFSQAEGEMVVGPCPFACLGIEPEGGCGHDENQSGRCRGRNS
jgi:hypothetical protein